MHQEQSAAGTASKYDSYALDKMSIRASPKVFGARIRCVAVCCRLQGFTMADSMASLVAARHHRSSMPDELYTWDVQVS